MWQPSDYFQDKSTLPVHIQYLQQILQVLLRKEALNPFIPLPVYMLRIASSEVWVLALGLHSSNTSWCWNELTLQASQSPSGWHLILQFGVMHKPTEGALNLTIYVINEYTKGPQYGPLEDTICYQFSFGHFLNVALLWEIEVLSLLTEYLHTALLILQHNVDLSMLLCCTHMSFPVWESSFSVKI